MNGNIGSESRARATLVAISSLELTADDSPLSGAASATVVLTALEDLLGATVVLWWERDIRGGRRARDPVASLGVHVDTLIPDDHVDRVGRLGIPERVHGVDGADRLVVPVVGKDGVLAVLDLVPRPGTPNFDGADLAAAIALAARLESSLTIWGLFDALQRQVDTDPLTGLPNRVALRGYLDAVLADASDKAGGPAVIFVDVDRFKDINDTLGHSAGDIVLRTVATRLQKAVRAGDFVARFGGDEFVIVASGPRDPTEFTALLDRITAVPEEPFPLHGTRLYVTVSAGLAHSGRGIDGETLLRRADAAMYEAKRSATHRWRSFDPGFEVAAREELMFDAELHDALKREQFEVYFQAVLGVETGRVVGHEALVRWNHPTRGLLLPGSFLAAMERNGLIVPLGAWVLRQSLLACTAWPDDVRVSVNLAARQIADPDLPDRVLEALAAAGVSPSRLVLELSETAVLVNPDTVGARLQVLHDHGVMIAIDDFGIGYTSIDQVRRLPVDVLKIDRSFIEGMKSASGVGLVAAILGLARALGAECVAEGVETSDEFDQLIELGCAAIQGFYCARPVPLAAVQNVFTPSFVLPKKWEGPQWSGRRQVDVLGE